MPSCTIVPSATATSVTRDPHALPTVPMSTPWSSVHADGGSTRLSGLSGNTHPLGAPVAGVGVAAISFPVRTHVWRALSVAGPATPSTGLRPAACWKRLTEADVPGPKLPSAFVGIPTLVSHSWSVLTSAPVLPTLRVRPKGGAGPSPRR